MESFLNVVVIISILSIWSIVLINIVLIVAGYLYGLDMDKEPLPEIKDGYYPFVSIMIPAHNEAIVIGRTLESMLEFTYPKDRYEVIIINDNSSDNSKEILEDIKSKNPDYNITLIHTTKENGGKGKSNALNIGFKSCKGEYIAIYDADNTPEPTALTYLVATLKNNDEYGAVIGKFRTRNRNASLLTRFVNIETLSFQWMAQAGRWKMFKLSTIPGTNFVLRRSIIEDIGGWDEKAIAEDTEISFRIYKMGYKIRFLPIAVTWEQEPQTLRVWFKQRTRWAKGNIYVLVKNLNYLWDTSPNMLPVKMDLLYFLSIYFLLLSSLITSDILFITSILGILPVELQGFSNLLWLVAFILFILGIFVSLVFEKGELILENLFIIILMYFTYVQLWVIVSAYALYLYIKDFIKKAEPQWYKTERF